MNAFPDASSGGGAVVGHVEGVRQLVGLDPSLETLVSVQRLGNIQYFAFYSVLFPSFWVDR